MRCLTSVALPCKAGAGGRWEQSHFARMHTVRKLLLRRSPPPRPFPALQGRERRHRLILRMRSLSARVALSAGIVLAVFIALAAFALDQAFRDSARSAREERLLAQVYLLMSAAEVDAHGAVTIATGPLEPRFEMPQSGLYATVINAAGHVVWRSSSALNVDVPYGAQIPAGVHTFEQVTDRTGRAYFLQSFGVSWATSGGSFPFTFSVAEDLQPFEQQLRAYRKNLWGWLGATAVLLLIAQSLTLRWGLRPLRRLADEVSRLEHGERQQIEGDYPAEVKGVTDNLNTLLTHERARQKRYRDALADLAHSLKTPLALVRGTLNQSQAAPEIANALHEQVERMDRIVGYHLQRAASGSSGLVAPQPVRPAVERMVNALAKVYAEKHIDTHIDDRCCVAFPRRRSRSAGDAGQRARQCVQMVQKPGARERTDERRRVCRYAWKTTGPALRRPTFNACRSAACAPISRCRVRVSVSPSRATSSRRTKASS